MTVKKIFELGLINDSTKIYIRNPDMYTLAYGNWFHDNVLKYLDSVAEFFTWQDDNKFYIDLK